MSKKVWAVDVQRVETGVVYVVADSLDEAIDIARDGDYSWHDVHEDYDTMTGQTEIEVIGDGYSAEDSDACDAINYEDWEDDDDE